MDGVDDDINYFRSYTRVQPYLIGIMLGYILFKTRGKQVKIPKVLNNYQNNNKDNKKTMSVAIFPCADNSEMKIKEHFFMP